MKFKRYIAWLGLAAVIVAAVGLSPFATYAAPLPQSGNLLQNPGLEQPYQGCGSGQTASGWKCWYTVIPKPEPDASALQYSAQAYFSAETNPSGKYPELIHGGEVSQHFGYQLDPWIAGLYQTVTVPPNAQLRFCVWSRMHASNTENPTVDSVTSYLGRAQVGIAPDGGTNGGAANVVWSGKSNPHDSWQQICVEATSGAEGKATVFTANDWRGAAAKHLDVWWDDAELVALGVVPTVQPTAAGNTQPQPTTIAQPQPTAAPPVTNADGSIVHTIVSGDTLFGLSFQYNVALEDILALNGLTKDALLSIGQKIIIKGGTGTQPVQPTAAAQATAAPGQPVDPAQPTVAPAAPAPPTPAQPSTAARLCVQAYSDANSDGLLTAGEEPVAGVQFAVANSQGVQAASYTTDAAGEAHCFTDLPPGSYTVAVQPAPGTVATSDKRWGVALTGGSVVDINFGSRSDGSAPAAGSQPGQADATPQSGSGSGLGGLLTGAIGLIVLLVAGVLGAFVIARRRA